MKLYKLEKQALDLIVHYAGRKPAVSFSGGMDSLVALDLSIKAGVKIAVFCNTSLEFPETLEYIRKIKGLYNDVEFIVLNPPIDFFSLSQKLLLPTRRIRWCCEVFKIAPLGKFAVDRGITSYITGLRRSEGYKRRQYKYVDRHPLIPTKRLNPILNWTRLDVLEYINTYGLPVNPLYKLGYSRVGCWACPNYSTRNYWKKLKKTHPELYSKLLSFLERYMAHNDVNFDTYLGFWELGMHYTISEIVGLIDNEKHQILFKNPEIARRASNALPINHKVQGNKIVINGNFPLFLVRKAVERGINCLGCGACLPLCPNKALKLVDGHIYIDREKCTCCLKCIIDNPLYSGCISRHYRLKIFRVYPQYDTNISICLTKNSVGILRRRLPLQKILAKLGYYRTSMESHDRIFVVNGDGYKLLIKSKEKSKITEIIVCTENQDLDNVLRKLRKKLK